MPARTSDEKGVCLSVFQFVCPSVCLSDKRMHCDKMERKICPDFILYERSFSLVFSEKEWLVGRPHLLGNFGSTFPRWSEIADFEPIFARGASAVTPSEKKSN